MNYFRRRHVLAGVAAIVVMIAMTPALLSTAPAAAAPAAEASADLSISNVHQGQFQAGSTGVYTIQVTNNGPDNTQNVTVQVTLADGETFASGAGGTNGHDWDCSAVGQQVSCTLNGALMSETDAPDLTLTVDVDEAATGVLTTTATVTGPDSDPNLENNDSTDTTSVASTEADLGITKTADTETFTAGDTAGYDIVVANAGPSGADGPITVHDTLPAGETFVSGSGGDWQCAATGPAVTCVEPDSLASGTSLPTLALSVQLAADYPLGTVTNVATVSGSTPDSSEENNTAVTVTPVVTRAGLTLVKTHTGEFLPGTDGTYTIQIGNDGPSDAVTVRVEDPLPTGETLVAASGTDVGDETWQCTVDLAQIVQCVLSGPLPAGDTSDITLTVHVAADFSGDAITNIATATTTTPDPDAPVHATDVVNEEADIVLSKSHEGTVVAGRQVTYTLTVRDDGPAAAAGPITVADLLPPTLTYVSAGGSGWECAGNAETPVVTCARPDGLADDDSAPPVTVVALVDQGAGGTEVTNTAAAESDSADPVVENNIATDSAEVTSQADLSVALAGTGPLVPGHDVTYTLKVHNAGPSEATRPTVRDVLPAGLTFVSAEGAEVPVLASERRAAVLDGPGVTCTHSGDTVTCVLPDLPAGQTAPTITVVAAVTPAAYPAVTDSASVHSDTPDPVEHNNSTSVRSSVAPVSSLSITKTHDGPVRAGGTVAYTITVGNTGPTPDPGPVTVTDPLPAGLRYRSADGPGWTCASHGQRVVCTHKGTLAVGADVKVVLVADVSASAPANVVNTATVTSAADQDRRHAVASDPTAIEHPATPAVSVLRGRLAFTGVVAGPWLVLGGIALVAGLCLVAWGRRRPG